MRSEPPAVIAIDGPAAVAARTLDPDARIVASPEALLAGLRAQAPGSVVAFVPEPALTFDLCRGAIDAAVTAGLALGLVPCDPRDPDRARRTAITLVAPPDPAPRRGLVLYSDELAARHESGPVVYLGPDDALADEVAAGAGAIVLHTHSNGVDHRIGRDILCVQADALRPSAPVAGERAFPCQAGGPCLREVRRTRRFVGAAALRAPAIVMLSCTGFVPADGIVDYRFGLAGALLRGPWVRAVVASFLVHTLPLEVALATARFLNEGGTVGELVAVLNQIVRVPSYVCLGDPDVVIPPALRAPALSSPPAPAAAVGDAIAAGTPASDDDVVARPRLQAAIVTRIADDRNAPPVCDRVRALAGALVDGPAHDRDRDRELARQLIDAVARGGFLFKDWQRELPLGPQTETDRRHACGRRLAVSRGTSPRCPEMARDLWVCERCGHSIDVPAGLAPPPLVLRPGHGELTLGTFIAGGAWIASVVEPVGELVEPVAGPRWIDPTAARAPIPIETAPVHATGGLRWVAVVAVADGEWLLVRAVLEAA